jgi:hypothetical protein
VKLLLDEHYRPVIATELRRRGLDVIAVAETELAETGGMRGLLDEPLLRRATAEGRVLVTENVRDLVPIHRRFLSRGETHAGILITTPRRCSREREAVGRLIMALAEFMETHESVAGTVTWL